MCTVIKSFNGHIQKIEKALRYNDLKSQMAKDQMEQVLS